MGRLSYWTETLMTLQRQGSGKPGTLLSQVGVEFFFPLVPPGFETSISTSVNGISQRGIGTPGTFQAYCDVMFRIDFGQMVPGAFKLSIQAGGLTAYSGTLSDGIINDGINYLYFLMGNSNVQMSVTNLTNLNQRFEMTSQFLICTNEEDFIDMKNQLQAIKFPYPLPEGVIK